MNGYKTQQELEDFKEFYLNIKKIAKKPGDLPKKEQILQFVESQGSATSTQIKRFIVDLNYGEGTFDRASKVGRTITNYNPTTREYTYAKCNPFRGYYSTALWNGGPYNKSGFLISGTDYLVKAPGHNGKWSVVRGSK